ncbi:MAG: metal-dependent hydrolase [Deltaproteobacteria bacterium CG17_big_fil_post_rev_8_21_14_2_50_63_7]|nr:MAG: metal-dependent hydrolase [Deltaproteobacteria bacterium CG17_big_fil_post_rev_8_21_14_2_50_63_7]
MACTLNFYGHFALGLEIDGLFVLVDPFFTGNPAATNSAADFDQVDYILVTHGHGDHVGDTVELAKRTGATVIANFEVCNWLQSQGVEKVHAQHIGGAHDHAFGNLKLTIAHHGSSMPDGSYGGNPAGLLIKTKAGEKLYVSGDTGLFYDMTLIGEVGLDLAVIPIGDNFTMGPDDALRAVKFLKPKTVVPAHFGTWPIIDADAESWAARVEKQTETKVAVMKAGDSLVV